MLPGDLFSLADMQIAAHHWHDLPLMHQMDERQGGTPGPRRDLAVCKCRIRPEHDGVVSHKAVLHIAMILDKPQLSQHGLALHVLSILGLHIFFVSAETQLHSKTR